MSETKSKIIGIDLGTSNSAAAFMNMGRPELIPSSEGAGLYGKAFPSVVAFPREGPPVVGETAKNYPPSRTITTIKRKMGIKHKQNIDGKDYTPEQISALILRKIKSDAENRIGQKVEKVVITVPAYFDANQRKATEDAGKIAGLDVIRLLDEPTAAALSYGFDKKDLEQKVMVFDFGGGTLDITIMDIGGGVLNVITTTGDTQLGGEDMTQAILDYFKDEVKQQRGVDLKDDADAIRALRLAAEQAKVRLSTEIVVETNIPNLSADNNFNFRNTLSRAKLEDIVFPILQKCEEPIKKAFSDAKLDSSSINKIILVGGPTRMPCVREFVKKSTGHDPETGIDPMECVAHGAALQASIMSGDSTTSSMVVIDNQPLSIGIETLGGVHTKLIPRNTTIPTKKTQIFSTAADNQDAVQIKICQGERPMASDNTLLGEFILGGIPPAPRGIPQIEVTVDVDPNKIIKVSAKDLATSKEMSTTITASSNLSDDEIEKAKKDAEQFADEDKKRKKLAEATNTAEHMIYTAERTKNDLKDKLSEEQVSQLDQRVKDLKDAIPSNDISLISEKTDAFSKFIQELSSSVYKQTESTQSSPPPHNDNQESTQSSPPPHNDNQSKDSTSDTVNQEDVVDADFDVTDDSAVDNDNKP